MDENVEDEEDKGSGPDTLLIRDRRSPLHSRCTAGDSPRPSRSSRAGFLSRPALHPAYAISHSVWWTTLSLLLLLLLLREGEQKSLRIAPSGKKRSFGNGCAKCARLPNHSNGYRFILSSECSIKTCKITGATDT